MLSGAACIFMSHVDPGTPYCMPASLAVGRHPPNAPFRPSPCGPSYATSRGGQNADLSTESAVDFNDIYWKSSFNRDLSHLCTTYCRLLKYLLIELTLKYWRESILARVLAARQCWAFDQIFVGTFEEVTTAIENSRTLSATTVTDDTPHHSYSQ